MLAKYTWISTIFFFICLTCTNNTYSADFNYSLNDPIYDNYDGISITGCSETCPENLVIPNDIDGYSVTRISNRAFYNQELISVTVPSSVKYIGKQAFSKNYITNLNLPIGFIEIETGAFYDNPELYKSQYTYRRKGSGIEITGCLNICSNSLVIPQSIEGYDVVGIIGEAFAYNGYSGSGNINPNARQIRSVTLPNTIKEIGPYAFHGNYLINLHIPEGIEIIDVSAFSGNELSSISLPNTLKKIERYAFGGNNLKTVSISNAEIHISDSAFSDNTGYQDTQNNLRYLLLNGEALIVGCWNSCAENINIPSQINGNPVVKIAGFSFQSNGLKSVAIQNGVSSIGSSAFSGNQITSITLPESINVLGAFAFSYNTLTYIQVPTSTLGMASDAFYGNPDILSSNSLWRYRIISGTASITDCVNCYDLTHLVIPNQIDNYPVSSISSLHYGSDSNYPSHITLNEGIFGFYGNSIMVPVISFPESLNYLNLDAFQPFSLNHILFTGDRPKIHSNTNYDHRSQSTSSRNNIFSYEVYDYINELELFELYCRNLANTGSGSDDSGSDDSGSDDSGSDDSGSDDSGSDDFGSDDSGSDDFGSDDFGSDDFGSGGIGSDDFGAHIFSSELCTELEDFGYEYFLSNLMLMYPFSYTSQYIPSVFTYNSNRLGWPGEKIDGVPAISSFWNLQDDLDQDGIPDKNDLAPLDDTIASPSIAFKIYDNEIEVSGCLEQCQSELVIPTEIYYYPVVTISENAFKNKQLTSLIIPNSVTSIGDSAFANNQLDSITLSNSITSIGEHAFAGNSLKTLEIPSSITAIPDGAFANITSLEAVIINSSVTTVDENAFEGVTADFYLINQAANNLSTDNFPSDANFLSCNSLSTDGIPENCQTHWNTEFDDIQTWSFDNNNFVWNIEAEDHPTLDFDKNNTLDALTDGLLLLRYAFGLRGENLTSAAIGTESVLTPEEVESNVEQAIGIADIDNNGSIDALTDGLLLLRYAFGLRGENLTNSATASDATRTSAEDIEAYIESHIP